MVLLWPEIMAVVTATFESIWVVVTAVGMVDSGAFVGTVAEVDTVWTWP